MPLEEKISILEKILERKKARLSEAKRNIPFEALEKRLSERESVRNFMEGLHRDKEKKAAIIAEIKRKSPSKGNLAPDLEVSHLAAEYEKGGAAALSVLTEQDFFGGSESDLLHARAATTLPVLRKDFIFSPYQVLESAVLGADAILLIARILDPMLLKELASMAEELGMTVLHEINGPDEIPAVLSANPKIVGINNRDLASFHTDISHAPAIAEMLPESVLPIALSGIQSRDDILSTRKQGIHSFLVGEALVKSENPALFLKELTAKGGKP